MELDRRKFLYLSLLGGAGALFLPNACRKSFEADVSRPIDQNISSIIFAIDISPSMGDPLDGTRKIDLVREALDAVFHQFKAHQDRYFNIETGLVEFGGTNKTLALAKFDYQRMHQAVEDMGFNEGTAIGYALSAATDELNLNATGKRSIILLTDGENNTGPLPGEVYAKIKSDNPNQYCQKCSKYSGVL